MRGQGGAFRGSDRPYWCNYSTHSTSPGYNPYPEYNPYPGYNSRAREPSHFPGGFGSIDPSSGWGQPPSVDPGREYERENRHLTAYGTTENRCYGINYRPGSYKSPDQLLDAADESLTQENKKIINLLWRLCHADSERSLNSNGERNKTRLANGYTKRETGHSYSSGTACSIKTHFCHPDTLHYFSLGPVEEKIFCGYQNIRAAMSCLNADINNASTSSKFINARYNIRDLQRYIVDGWDEEIDDARMNHVRSSFEDARRELSPLLGTTKAIGIKEVEAFYYHFRHSLPQERLPHGQLGNSSGSSI
jgi:peptidase C78-like protein